MKELLHHVGILSIAVALLLVCAMEMGTAQDLSVTGNIRALINSTSPTSYKLGRATVEATWGVAASANDWALGSSIGDVILRTELGSNEKLLFVNGSSPSTVPTMTLSQGRVAIGTTATAGVKFTVSTTNQAMRIDRTTTGGILASFGGQGVFNIDAPSIVGGRLTVLESGDVGIGTPAPDAKLKIIAANGPAVRAFSNSTTANTSYRLGRTADEATWAVAANPTEWAADAVAGDVVLRTEDATKKFMITNGSAKAVLTVGNGRTKTKILEITGGSDLAEPFEFSDTESLRPGSVVVIDDENPGRLKLSERAYDKRVAGIVSGAGGINPGLTLHQEGVNDRGQNVALNGRVYVFASTSNGAIVPGDLLTTSDVPGHAMKATDSSLSHGTVIGKAMSRLDEGKGLVLVLVNLQ